MSECVLPHDAASLSTVVAEGLTLPFGYSDDFMMEEGEEVWFLVPSPSVVADLHYCIRFPLTHLQDFEYEDDGDEEQDQDAGIENKYYTAKSKLVVHSKLFVQALRSCFRLQGRQA